MTDENNEALDDYSDPTDKHGDCKLRRNLESPRPV